MKLAMVKQFCYVDQYHVCNRQDSLKQTAIIKWVTVIKIFCFVSILILHVYRFLLFHFCYKSSGTLM